MNAFESVRGEQKRRLHEKYGQAKPKPPCVFDDFHCDAERRIRQQDVAVQRPIRHLEEIEHGRIRTAAIHNVAGVDSEAALAHGDHQIAQAAERLGHGGYASQ